MFHLDIHSTCTSRLYFPRQIVTAEPSLSGVTDAKVLPNLLYQTRRTIKAIPDAMMLMTRESVMNLSVARRRLL